MHDRQYNGNVIITPCHAIHNGKGEGGVRIGGGGGRYSYLILDTLSCYYTIVLRVVINNYAHHIYSELAVKRRHQEQYVTSSGSRTTAE